MKCLFCQNEIPDDSKFCPICGAQSPFGESAADAPYAADDQNAAYPPSDYPQEGYPQQDNAGYQNYRTGSYSVPNYQQYPSGYSNYQYQQPPRPPKKSGKGAIIALSIIIGVLVLLIAAFFIVRYTVGFDFLNFSKAASAVLPDETKALPDVTFPVDTTAPDQGDTLKFETFVSRNNALVSEPTYFSCLELRPDGVFVLTENLLSGMGKIRGYYTVAGSVYTLDVQDTYDTSYAGSNVKQIIFTRDGDRMTIADSLCSTEAGDVFVLDNSFVPSDAFYEGDYEMGYPDEATVIYDMPETMYVNAGYNSKGDTLYLYMRTVPDKSDSSNILYALPHLTQVEVHATNANGTWAWVYYSGPAHDAKGNDAYMEGFAWCALSQDGYDYLTYTPNYWQ